MELLAPGNQVLLQHYGLSCEVDDLLGSGGQGEVYRVHVNRDGGQEPYALKWYYEHAATDDQLAILHALVKQGAPNERFAWPLDIATRTGAPGFGYVMPLRTKRYHGIVEMMDRRILPSFRAVTIAGLQLADGFWQLHAAGLCYRDISFGNVFLDPEAGDVLICDNDNVGIDGRSKVSVRGTNGFMAPEIVRGEAMPSIATDLYSLSVLLFYMFMVHHPLQGRRELDEPCWDGAAMRRLYGEQPVFIFDPTDQSNGPVEGWHDNALVYWSLYPTSLRDLFIQAFTDGLQDPKNGRVRETVWRLEMARLHDLIVNCDRCANENFYDSDDPSTRCWNCSAEISLPPRLIIDEHSSGGGRTVMLNYGQVIRTHHLHPERYDHRRPPVGEVVRHPQHHDIWGLRNVSEEAWTVRTADGATHVVEPQRSVTLAPGTRVQFGRIEGVIRF